MKGENKDDYNLRRFLFILLILALIAFSVLSVFTIIAGIYSIIEKVKGYDSIPEWLENLCYKIKDLFW